VKILITGGAGFIGSHVAEACLREGHEVLAADDLSSGRRANVPEGATFAEVDVRDADAVARMVADFRPDAVDHHAAQTSVAVSIREPQRDAEINLRGTCNLLDACARAEVPRFVFASTGGAIYGEVADGDRADVERPPNPPTPYGRSKLAAEGRLASWATEHGARGSVLRYSNVYGPRQDPHGEAGVIAIFASRLLRNEPVTVFARERAGDAGCTRDYVYVADVVRANMAAIEGRLDGETLNVCSGVATTTLELAQTLRELTGSGSAIDFGPPRVGDVAASVLAPGRFATLGEVTPLRDGLERTIEWFRNRHGPGHAR
jgi:UDP-glucose 4-epimerase